jgi:hypothetical protein
VSGSDPTKMASSLRARLVSGGARLWEGIATGEQDVTDEVLAALRSYEQALEEREEAHQAQLATVRIKAFDEAMYQNTGRGLPNGHLEQLSDSYRLTALHDNAAALRSQALKAWRCSDWRLYEALTGQTHSLEKRISAALPLHEARLKRP